MYIFQTNIGKRLTTVSLAQLLPASHCRWADSGQKYKECKRIPKTCFNNSLNKLHQINSTQTKGAIPTSLLTYKNFITRTVNSQEPHNAVQLTQNSSRFLNYVSKIASNIDLARLGGGGDSGKKPVALFRTSSIMSHFHSVVLVIDRNRITTAHTYLILYFIE